MLLLTGQRRDEIGSLRWPEVDTDAKTITLPATRTKNGREHLVPLSAVALDVLSATPKRSRREPVFGDGEGIFGLVALERGARREARQGCEALDDS
jgi:integrase